jgi:probable HAF family extracellular repeat protein
VRVLLRALAIVALITVSGCADDLTSPPVRTDNAAGSLTPASGDPRPGQQWTFLDLGTLGGTAAAAVAVNRYAQVVANVSTGSGGERAVVWREGIITDLGSLGGTVTSARDINASGQVVGRSRTTGNAATHAFLWQNGVMTDLGTLGGTNSSASALNSLGHVVGTSELPGDSISHAFLWRAGVMTDLGTLGGKSSELPTSTTPARSWARVTSRATITGMGSCGLAA